MTPAQAMQLTGVQCSWQSLHQRIGCWRSKLVPPQLLQLQAIEAEWTASPAISSSKSSHSTATNKEQITPLSSSRSGGGGRKGILPPTLAPSTLKAISEMPSWLDVDKTLAAMTTRKQHTPTQICRANFDWNAKEKYYQGQYSDAFKQASLELSEALQSRKTRGQCGCGCGARAIASIQKMVWGWNES
jgi:hypothetical protein